MKMRLFTVGLLLLASAAFAQPVQTVLTSDSTLYRVRARENALEVSRRKAETREVLVVPGTADAIADSDPRLLWDGDSKTLFVVWHRAAEGLDEIRLVSFANGVWSEPLLIASGVHEVRSGLRAVLTYEPIGESGLRAALVHAAWWSMGSIPVAEYALVAFEKGAHVSTDVARLTDLAGAQTSDAEELEEMGAAIHPPLEMSRAGRSVDVVFGSVRSTAVTRLVVTPRQVTGDARIWRPAGRTGGRTGPARLVSPTSEPVGAFVTDDRVVLYTAGAKFRFIVLEHGRWTPIRQIDVDGKLTGDEILEQLRRTLDEQPLAAPVQ